MMVKIQAAVLALAACLAPVSALAQSCPAPLSDARRLMLVTAENMTTREATAQLFERATPGDPWRPIALAEPALVGRNGIAWSYFFRTFSRKGEPLKVEGDKRAPAGIYRIGKSFGILPSGRAGYTQLTEGTTCIDDPQSPAYNTIASRAKVGWKVHGENMWRVPEYRSGLFVDYPTNARARAGSCIFIHVRLPEKNSTGGCVALPQARVEAVQDFAQAGAVLAILPRAALGRFEGCLPVN